MKKLNKELGKLAALCAEISATTEHDVFFKWSPHVRNFCVYVYEGGWPGPSVYITDIGGDELSFFNLKNVRRELHRYEKSAQEAATSSGAQ